MKNKEKENLDASEQIVVDAIHVVEPTNVLATIKASQLIDVTSWREKQERLLEENPFFEIVDNKTYEAGKKHRTNIVKGRTELQNQDKLVASTFATIRKEVGSETAVLIEITQPLEDKWQKAVKDWEDRKEREKQAAKEAEELRIKTIKDKIDEIESACHEIIQKMVFSEIDFSKTKLFAFFTIDFDFEEYDILFEQVKSRVESALEIKVKSLTDSENQRLENIRLEEQNKEIKRLSDLQAARLTEIMPYVAFGEVIDLTKLSELEDKAYLGILSSKKSLFESDAREKKKAQEKLDAENLEKDRKVKEEKEKIFVIRKNRLAEIGLVLHEGVFMDSGSVCNIQEEIVFYSDAIDFETIIANAKLDIEKAKADAITQKLQSRVSILKDLGFKEDVGVEYPFQLLDKLFTNEEILADRDDAWFEGFIQDAHIHIKAADEQKSIEDAKKLKAENKARIKKYASDRKALHEFLDGLYFHNTAPELENEYSKEVLAKLIIDLSDLKQGWFNNIENI